MRISSLQVHNQAVDQLGRLGAEAARTQQQLGTGKRIQDPSDDPLGAARVVSLNQEIEGRAQYLRNIDALDVNLALEDSTLRQIGDAVARVQELTLQAGSGIQTSEDRAFIAAEIRARFDELLSLVNTRDADGQYIFGGFRTDQPPFELVGDDIVFSGDSGQRFVQVDRGQQVALNDPAEDIFVRIESAQVNAVAEANTTDSNVALDNITVVDQNLAAELFPDKLVVEFRPESEAGGVSNFTVRRQSDQRVVDGLENVPFDGSSPVTAQGISFEVRGVANPGERLVISTNQQQGLLDTVRNIAEGLVSVDALEQPEAFRSLIDNTIFGLEQATSSLLRTRTDIGARLNTIDNTRDFHEELTLQLRSTLSDIEDLDFTEAVSNLSFQTFVLEAAQQGFIRINNLSLFDRL